jgi:hypothetical protein
VPTATITTFEQIINRYRDLIAAVLQEDLAEDLTPEQFTLHVADAAAAVEDVWGLDPTDMDLAANYLGDAWRQADDSVRSESLIRANGFLTGYNEEDFIS